MKQVMVQGRIRMAEYALFSKNANTSVVLIKNIEISANNIFYYHHDALDRSITRLVSELECEDTLYIDSVAAFGQQPKNIIDVVTKLKANNVITRLYLKSATKQESACIDYSEIIIDAVSMTIDQKALHQSILEQQPRKSSAATLSEEEISALLTLTSSTEYPDLTK
jgi:hypothetical protein